MLGRDPIPQSGRYFFSLFLNKISYCIFSVGIVNQKRRNYEKSYESPDCISLFGKNAMVWQDTICRGGGA